MNNKNNDINAAPVVAIEENGFSSDADAALDYYMIAMTATNVILSLFEVIVDRDKAPNILTVLMNTGWSIAVGFLVYLAYHMI